MNHTPVSTGLKKRKFPGPAGLLESPDLDITCKYSKRENELNHHQEGTSSESRSDENLSLSQASSDIFSSPSWKNLLDDLGADAEAIIAKFSIKAMLLKAKRKLLPKGKIPLILGIIESMDQQGQNASVIIRDLSGKMQGSLHRDLFIDPLTSVLVGSVLVLRQVSVISPSVRTHYLNITPGNVALIYSPGRDGACVNKRPWKVSPLKTMNSSVSPADIVNPSIVDIIKDSEKELTVPVTHRIQNNVGKQQPSPNRSYSSPLLQPTHSKGQSFSFQSPLCRTRNFSTSESPLFSPLTSLSSPRFNNNSMQNTPRSSPNLCNNFTNNKPTSSSHQQIIRGKYESSSRVNTSPVSDQNIASLNHRKDVNIQDVDVEPWFSDDDEDLLMCDVSNQVEDSDNGEKSLIKNNPDRQSCFDNDGSEKNANSITNCFRSPSGNSNIISNNNMTSDNDKSANIKFKSVRNPLVEERDFQLSSVSMNSCELFSQSPENESKITRTPLQLETMERTSRLQPHRDVLPVTDKDANDDFWDNDLSDELLSQLTEDF